VTDFEAYLASTLVHVSMEVRFIEAFEPVTDLERKFIYLPLY
jgi:hypothetical protein